MFVLGLYGWVSWEMFAGIQFIGGNDGLPDAQMLPIDSRAGELKLKSYFWIAILFANMFSYVSNEIKHTLSLTFATLSLSCYSLGNRSIKLLLVLHTFFKYFPLQDPSLKDI